MTTPLEINMFLEHNFLSKIKGVENLEKTTSFGKKEIKSPNIAQMNRLGVNTSTLAQTEWL